MSRENRILAMYFVGVVLLFTYFRFQYPNIGKHNEVRSNEQAPLISVVVGERLSSRVEKVARSYELEFGVRIMLEESNEDFSGAADSDLIIRSGSESFPDGIGIVHRMSFLSFQPDKEDVPEHLWELGVRAISDARQDGAVRFARYLMAADRGLPIVFPDESLEISDPWAVDPVPTILVWEGAYPLLKTHLRDFELVEGSKLSLVVADCASASQKMRNSGETDGVIVFNEICPASEIAGWDEVSINSYPLVLLSSMDRDPVLNAGVEVGAEAVLLGLLPGMSMALERPGVLEALPRSLQNIIQQGDEVQYSRSRDLINGILEDSNVVGVSISGAGREGSGGVRGEPILHDASVFELRMRVSKESSYRHLLLRLSSFLARKGIVVSEGGVGDRF